MRGFAAPTAALLLFLSPACAQKFNRTADQLQRIPDPLFNLLKSKYSRIFCDLETGSSVRLVKVNKSAVHRVATYSRVRKSQIRAREKNHLEEIQARLIVAGANCLLAVPGDNPDGTEENPNQCSAPVDACGVCDGDGSSCIGCDGVPHSGTQYDQCGVCAGDGSSCAPSDNGTNQLLGINLGIINSWEPQILTTNLFKQSFPFVQNNPNGTQSGYPCVDGRGWPIESPCPADGSTATTNIMNGGTYPGGNYTFAFQGTGSIEIRGQNVVGSPKRFTQAGTYTLAINQGQGTVFLEFLQSSKNDPIRAIRFDLPGHDSRVDIFYPPAMRQLRGNGGFKVLRLMNATATNNNIYPLSWATRRLPSNEQYSGSEGKAAEALPIELIDDLANAADASPWISIPFNADDSYVIGLAAELNRNLAANLKVYVEYSNEIWNTSFLQNAAAKSRGALQFGVPASFRSAQMWTVYRSAQIVDLFERNFDDDSRLYFVLPGQAGPISNFNQSLTSYLSDPIVNPLGKRFDGLAVAAYVNVDPLAIIDAGCVSSITVEDILTVAGQLISGPVSEPHSCPGFLANGGGSRISTSQMVAAQRTLAASYDMELIAYEGGQHLVSPSQELNTKFIAANRDPRMYDLTTALINTWHSQGGQMFMFYKYISSYGSSGSWGSMEHFLDTDNAKWQALQGQLTIPRQ